ncbi:hypothetical protein MKW98_003581 [Papaver atlanticum]|uniref:F-box associated beta-propeller type 1 domain-containing protein n=1 Tax=Papaver atlanticum TaxID=357466 RepID=A0AAD4SHE7_9MAGN|nr:hypothetical protein MKW98_003581 [Papaver atlanticum]
MVYPTDSSSNSKDHQQSSVAIETLSLSSSSTTTSSSAHQVGLFFEKCSNPQPGYVYDFLLLDGSRIEEEEVKNSTSTAAGGRACNGLFKTLNFGNHQTRYIGPVIENGIRINQSCNGLLCCTRETEITNEDFEPHIYTTHSYIYNPTTRQYRILPPSPFRDVVRDDCCFKVCSISLAFDPMNSPDHYQVICIWKDVVDLWCLEAVGGEFHNYYYVEIYSSETNVWKKLISSSVNPFYALPGSFTKSGVYWNGSLHWIATEDDVQHESSMYFDIAQELVKPLPLPTTPSDDEWNAVYFGECGGHLYLIQVLASHHTNYNILKMETDYSGWKLIYKLDLERFIAAYPGFDTYAFDSTHMLYRMVLLLEEDEEDSLSKMVVLVDGKKVISYDLKEMSITEIHTFTEGNVFSLARTGGLWGYLHHYIESLACV